VVDEERKNGRQLLPGGVLALPLVDHVAEDLKPGSLLGPALVLDEEVHVDAPAGLEPEPVHPVGARLLELLVEEDTVDELRGLVGEERHQRRREPLAKQGAQHPRLVQQGLEEFVVRLSEFRHRRRPPDTDFLPRGSDTAPAAQVDRWRVLGLPYSIGVGWTACRSR